MKRQVREGGWPMAIVSVSDYLMRAIQQPPVSAPGQVLEGQLLEAVEFPAGHMIRMTAAPPSQPVAVPATQVAKKKMRVLWPLISIGVVIAGGFVIPWAIDRGVYATAAIAVTGISVFAGLYAGAQIIERFLEPFSHWLLPSEDTRAAYGTAMETADKALTAWAADPTNAALKTKAETAMKTMAKKKNAVDERTDDRVAIFWAIASILGMLASAQFGLFLLKLIGIPATYAWDVFATGLILGSGTKPLHDLITNLSKSAAPSDAAGSGSTTTAT
jgi:hypothetical protein